MKNKKILQNQKPKSKSKNQNQKLKAENQKPKSKNHKLKSKNQKLKLKTTETIITCVFVCFQILRLVFFFGARDWYIIFIFFRYKEFFSKLYVKNNILFCWTCECVYFLRFTVLPLLVFYNNIIML